MKLFKLRKLLCILPLFLMLVTATAHAQEAKVWDWPTVSAAGPTTVLKLYLMSSDSDGSWISQFQTVSVTLGAGTNSVCVWQLEASDDNTNWFSISGTQDCTVPTMMTVAYRPARMVRVNVTSYTGTANLTFHWTGR